MSIEALAIAKGAAGLASLGTRLNRYLSGDPNVLLEPLAEAYREWVRDLDAAMKQQAELLRDGVDRGSEVEERVRALEGDLQMVRIWNNLGYDAMREVLEERRQMLAGAAVGLALSPLPIERKARVERTLRHLDPVDVGDLYAISRVVGSVDTDGTAVRGTPTLRHRLWADPNRVENAEVLLSAGCVQLPPGGGAGWGGASSQEMHLTKVGRELLVVMGSYVRRRVTRFEVPGRGLPLTLEDHARAGEAVAQLSGLGEFLRWIHTAPKVGRQYTMPGGGSFVVRDGLNLDRPFLQVDVFDPTKRSSVVGLEAKGPGTLAVYAGAEALSAEAPGAFTAYVTGPHEVLRVLADGDEWRWA